MPTYTLPFPPSNNKYYRRVGNKTLISAAGRKYREAVAGAIIEQRAKAAPAGRLSVELDVFPPNNIRRDLDNMPKALLDALKHAGVIEDDSLIDRLMITRRGVEKGGYVIALIRLAEECIK